MAEIHGKDIVKDGLVLHLDAANPQSYDGNSTIWRDLSGSGNHGTMIVSPTYSNSSKGYFSFNGSTTYLQLNSYWTMEVGYTVNIWINLSNSSGGTKYFLGNNVSNTSGILYNVDTSTFLLFDSGTSYTFVLYLKPSNWVYATFIRISSTSYSCYVNGMFIGTGNTGGTNNIIRFNLIGRRSDGYYTDSKISDISFYNKTLSQQEITQNFNSTKSRYGL